MTEQQKKLYSIIVSVGLSIFIIVKVIMFIGDIREDKQIEQQENIGINQTTQKEEQSSGKIDIQLPTMPFEVSSLRASGEIRNTYNITDIEYNAEYNFLLEQYSTTIYISGTKTFDRKGNDSNDNGSIHWKIYDKADTSIVVDSGTLFPPELCVGEKFEKESIHSYDLQKGRKYELVFYNE